MDKDLSDVLYNQKDICEAYFKIGKERAHKLLEEKFSFITENCHEHALHFENILLHSLNDSLYHYVLFNFDADGLGFSFVPYIPSKFGVIAKEHFFKEAERIFSEYRDFSLFESGQNKYIAEACSYIKNHINENLTLEKVSSCIYINKCHLSHLFKSCLQMNFSQYIAKERNTLAINLLCDKSLSIDDIAERCGFSSSSYFSTVFRKANGISPREYRKNILKRQ